jgi:hypothetical protein
VTQTGEGVAANRPQGSASDDADYKSVSSRILQIVVYSTKNATDGAVLFSSYARKARNLLLPHRLDLRASLGLPSLIGDSMYVIDWDATITLHDHKEQIMTLSQKLSKAPDDALPVIMCKIDDSVGDNGETMSFDGRKFVLLYVNHPSADSVTMLHEIGHAANCTNHPPWGLGRADKHYSFMATPAEFKPGSDELAKTKDPAYFRNTIFKSDVMKLALAPFSVPYGLCSYPPLFIGG